MVRIKRKKKWSFIIMTIMCFIFSNPSYAMDDLTQEKKVYIEGALGKGGRYREIDIPESYIEKLESIIKNKEKSDKVFSTSKRNDKKKVSNACKRHNIDPRGTHGFRGYSAFKELKKDLSPEQIEKIMDKHGNALTDKEKQALLKVSSYLGHGRIRIVIRHYLQR